MKIFFSALAVCLFSSLNIYSQCTELPSSTISTCVPQQLPEPGFSDTVACIVKGQPTYTTIYFQNFNQISGVTVEWMRIDSITNLPCGLTLALNQAPGYEFQSAENGCMTLTGTTYSSVGLYDLGIYVTLKVNILPNPISGEAGALSAQFNGPTFNFHIIVYNPGSPCQVISTTSIVTGTISTSSLCSGASVQVPYTASGTFNTGNVFTAQLSNASGNFASPVNIGSISSTSSGIINATIPLNTAVGSAYRIRAVSSNPTVTGSNNGADLAVISCGSQNGCSVLPSSTPSSCIPQPLSGPGFADSIVCVVQGQATNSVIYFQNFNQISGVTVEWMRIDSIANLPCGLTFALNQAPGYQYGSAENGCMSLTGITNSPAGQYQLRIYITIKVSILPNPIWGEAGALSAQFGGPDFKLFVIVTAPGNPCPGTTTSSIVTGTISTSSLCSGASVQVPYTASGTFNNGNVFTAQLSNASGNFASPMNIGSVSGTSSSGNINATIPSNTAPGSGYRIRVVSSNPPVNGSDNGINLIIGTSIVTGTISGSPLCTGSAVSVPFTSQCTFNAGNVFTAQLSNAFGSFSSSVNIGSVSGTSPSGNINATIPSNTTTGSGYRIRVVSSNPPVNGNDNGINLIIGTIVTGTISGSPLCTGSAVSVPFTSQCSFNTGNVFTAQLSNSFGSFSSPVNIGSVSGTSSSGSINATIPSNTLSGSGYRIRVISSNPPITGTANANNLILNRGVTITASSTTVLPGSQALVPVTVSGFQNIAGAQGTITFDPVVLSFVQAEQFGLPGMNIGNFGNPSSGSVRFSWDEMTTQGISLTDGSVIFALLFNLTGTAGQMTSLNFATSPVPLEFTNPQANSVCAVAVPGVVSIASSITLDGIIHSEAGPAEPIPTVTVNLTGPTPQSIVTGIGGSYNLTITQGGSYTITPSKSNDIVVLNGISTADILLIKRHILGISLGTPYKIIAADVNGSNSVTTLDILLIRSVILGNNPTFPNQRIWTFVPSSHAFTDPFNPFPYSSNLSYTAISQLSGQDFIGIKLGDVNNSWDFNILKSDAVGTVRFGMDEQNAMLGDDIIVPVNVKDFINITGYQFTISWNHEVLELVDVKNKSLNGFYGMMKISEGILTTAWDDDKALSVSLNDNETVFELRFKVIGKSGSSSEIKLCSELIPSEAYNNDIELLSILPTNGMVKVNDFAGDKGGLLSVIPNPFSETTTIEIPDEVNDPYELKLFDLIGNEIRSIRGIDERTVLLRKENLASGIYFIELRGEKRYFGKVMVE